MPDLVGFGQKRDGCSTTHAAVVVVGNGFGSVTPRDEQAAAVPSLEPLGFVKHGLAGIAGDIVCGTTTLQTRTWAQGITGARDFSKGEQAQFWRR